MKYSNIIKKGITILLVFICFAPNTYGQANETFTNPILSSGPDPWVIYHNGYYYYTHTLGDKIKLWKTKYLTNLKNAKSKIVWTPPAKGPNSQSIWAPELHFINGKWYIYYTATNAANPGDDTRYIFVLENESLDPLRGEWVDKGKINTHHSGLDGTVFKHKGTYYFVYSAYIGSQSRLFISSMINPWTLNSKQVQIAKPTYKWEKYGGRQIVEAPQFLAGPKDKLFIIYSASACWSDEYSLGMLTASKDSKLLDPDSWDKSSRPVFKKAPKHSVYATGHCSFFKSPDGTESWILYHANSAPGQGCGHTRSPRIQSFSWNNNGTPNFGKPVKAGIPIPVPSRK